MAHDLIRSGRRGGTAHFGPARGDAGLRNLGLSRADRLEVSGLEAAQNLAGSGHKRAEQLDVVAHGDEHEDGEIQLREILLVLDILVGSDQNIEPFSGLAQKLSVLDACPAHLRNGGGRLHAPSSARVLVPDTAIYLTRLELRIPTSQLSLSEPQECRRREVKLAQRAVREPKKQQTTLRGLAQTHFARGASSKPPGLAGLPVSR